MAKKEYYITGQQLYEIEHFQRMFEYDAEVIKDLCSSEKDDIVYGFALGELHSHLRKCFLDMMQLHSQIENQIIEHE